MTSDADPKPELDHKGDPVLWEIDPQNHQIEALGLLKDWVTTLITLQTSIIAAVAALVGFHGADEIHLTPWQAAPAGLAALCSLMSIISGVFLLNMLPAAAQRKPTPYLIAHPQDIFSIKTTGHRKWDPTTNVSITDSSRWFRTTFILAVLFLVWFAVAKIVFRS